MALGTAQGSALNLQIVGTLRTVGKNLAPALAAGAIVQGAFSDRMRLVMVAGASTTVGAPVVVRLAAQRRYWRPGTRSR